MRGKCACLLHVAGLEGRESAITAETWGTLPRASVQVVDHAGKKVTFAGVPAREVLKLVNPPLGRELREKNLAT
jgi:hypothetical protein